MFFEKTILPRTPSFKNLSIKTYISLKLWFVESLRRNENDTPNNKNYYKRILKEGCGEKTFAKVFSPHKTPIYKNTSKIKVENNDCYQCKQYIAVLWHKRDIA